MEGPYTKRDTLTGKSRSKKKIDMEEAYQMIDSGLSVADVALFYGVSASTLRRRHMQYQKKFLREN